MSGSLQTSYTAVIPAFNAAETLAEAIASIRAQTMPPQRILVVDDGSTDSTPDIAQAEGAEVLRQPNGGPGSATTLGLLQVRTPIVAFLDADDSWLEGKAEAQLRRLDERRDLDGIFGRLRCFRHGLPVMDNAPVQDGWSRSVMMLRTASALRVGPLYDPPQGNRGELIDWLTRARMLGLKFEMMSEILALRRIIAGSLSYGYNGSDHGYLDVARRSILRRRGLLATDKGN